MLFLFLLRFQLKQFDTARLQIPEYESWIEMASSLPGNYANTPSTAWSLARFNAVPELSVHHFWHSLSPSKVIESNQLATSILSRSSQETLEATYNSWQSIVAMEPRHPSSLTCWKIMALSYVNISQSSYLDVWKTFFQHFKWRNRQQPLCWKKFHQNFQKSDIQEKYHSKLNYKCNNFATKRMTDWHHSLERFGNCKKREEKEGWEGG